MTNSDIFLLHLLRASFQDIPLSIQVSEEDLSSVVDLAKQQGVAGLVFDALGKLPKEQIYHSQAYHKAMYAYIKQEKTWQKQWDAACEMAACFKREGLKMMVLKGFAVGMFYKDPKVRECCDVDCFLVDDEEDALLNTNYHEYTTNFHELNITTDKCGDDKTTNLTNLHECKKDLRPSTVDLRRTKGAQSPYERGNQVMEGLGIQVDRDFYKNSTYYYKGLMVENHQFCTAIRGSQKKKDFERYLQSIMGLGEQRIAGSEMWCPSPLFNVLFLTYHAQVHFVTEGGMSLRHMLDWAVLMKEGASLNTNYHECTTNFHELDIDKTTKYSEYTEIMSGPSGSSVVDNKKEDFRPLTLDLRQATSMDWLLFETKCKEFGFWKFACSMSQVAKRVYGVEIPFECPENKEADERMFQDIMHPSSKQGAGVDGWRGRMWLVQTMIRSNWKYRLYTETSLFANLCEVVWAFCFERKPRVGG